MGIVVLVGVASGLGWWAATVTLTRTPTSERTAVEEVTAEVVEATVGRSLSVGVTLRQPVEPVATNTLTGMVTEVSTDDEHEAGNTVFSVAGTPVRVIVGEVPFYRDLMRGTRGDDVEQLQQALVDLGYLDAARDGVFGAATAAAVERWQADLGIDRTGTVTLGEVLAVPVLPAPLLTGEQIRTGGLLAGGEDAILSRTGDQQFILVLSSDQASAITSEVLIRVAFEGLEWDARVVESTIDEAGSTVMTLANVDGGPVCQQDCARLPPDEEVSLRAEAVVVPEVTGPAVPVGAVRTSTDGHAYVVMDDASRQDVEVRGSGQGLAVIEGVEVGDLVRVTSNEDEDEVSPVDEGTTPTTNSEGD